MKTGELVEEYIKNGIKFHKRFVCNDIGEVISYTYTAYPEYTMDGIYGETADTELDAVKQLQIAIEKKLKMVNEDKRFVDNFLTLSISSEFYL